MHISALNNLIGHKFIELASVDSTNNYAMALANSATAAEGTVIFTQRQTAGKGQRGKQWLSKAGENIIMSVILRPYWLSASEQFLVNMAVALGVKNFFENYAGDATSIKWSNDLYWHDRKAGGVLIENSWRHNQWAFAVVGIGININQTTFADNLPNPVSLKQITGKDWDIKALIENLCSQLDQRYLQLRQGHYEQVIKDYQASLFRLNELAEYKVGDTVVKGIITAVETDGRLLLKTDDGLLKLNFGEISFVI